ncbi:CiaD-like domain-containing protein [Campylobacter sp. MOP7]|uniref:CiaD-like domain-containing protein n=1 Tax=Campylobacter canis TaxID=3378588 RepID=UPI00387E48B1
MKLEDIAKMAIDEVAAELENAKEHEPKEPARQPIIIEESKINGEINGEEIFLRNLKERILVLFEGLNATSRENLEDRLELTLKFLEFVLANVENRLENLQTK